MIKWIGQHIVSFIARFRNDVYLENLTESTQDHVVGIDSDGKLYKQDRGTTDSFTVEDGDTTDVVISNGKHWKFVEGGNIDINWTDTSTGSSSDEYDLTFSVLTRPSFEVIELISPFTIESRESVKIQVDSANTGSSSHIFDFVNGAGTTIGTLDKDGNLSIKGELRTLSAGGKGDLGQFVVANIPNLPGAQITSGTVDKDRLPDATSSDKGVIPKATAAETTTGTDDTKAATPKGVKDHFDSRKVHELALATAALNMNSQKITGVTDPTAAQDAATKNYVDGRTKSDIGLGNVENKSSATIRGEIVASDVPDLDTSKLTTGTLSKDRYVRSPVFSLTQYSSTVADDIHIGNNTYGNGHFNWNQALDKDATSLNKNYENSGCYIPEAVSKVIIKASVRLNASETLILAAFKAPAAPTSGDLALTRLNDDTTSSYVTTSSSSGRYVNMTLTHTGTIAADSVIFVGCGQDGGSSGAVLKANISVLTEI